LSNSLPVKPMIEHLNHDRPFASIRGLPFANFSRLTMCPTMFHGGKATANVGDEGYHRDRRQAVN